MSEFEALQMQVAALSARLGIIEKGQELLQSASVPLQNAQLIAIRAGIDPKALFQKERRPERRKLAMWLYGEGWGAGRIARIMFCSERTVERWLRDQSGREVTDGRMRTAFGGKK